MKKPHLKMIPIKKTRSGLLISSFIKRFCLDVAQGSMNRAPNETHTHL